MIRKLVAIVLAILINCGVLVWFHGWSANAVARATPATHPGKVLVLPTINVTPTPAQLRMLRRENRPAVASGSLRASDAGFDTLAMPYYSFAIDPARNRQTGA